jgi:serine protease
MRRTVAVLAAGTVLASVGVSAAPAAAEDAGWVATHGQRVLVHEHGRFGAVPPLSEVGLAASGPLRFGGGVDGIGVVTGAPRVFLVFWGAQWDAAGDPDHAAPYVRSLLAGVGTGGELWSGVMTQYCEGVPARTTSCPTAAPHVGRPPDGALAGVWADAAAAAPAQATHQDLAGEAVAAARHFGNTSAAVNRSAQYVIFSPTRTRPDGFPDAGFCAYHDYTTSSYGDLAFTNLPYLTDAGANCGAGFVNGTAGRLDGYSIVAGHEYAETITDPTPAGGWTAAGGQENGDLCAWLTTGPGRVQNVTLTTGTFPLQGTWSNETSDCEINRP